MANVDRGVLSLQTVREGSSLPDGLESPQTGRETPEFGRLTFLVSRHGQTWRASVRENGSSAVGAAETRTAAILAALVNLEVPTC